ncbi:GNAT family N-acetyltransferase [Streptomyces sp. NPDC008121]|uniref:GNAT family N-acetyltransferase n=1 Tax=Streptomyces sp. NPDC008121 TaxID=3364809 RepID=UPI0036E00B97
MPATQRNTVEKEPSPYTVRAQTPTVAEHRHLRTRAGLPPYPGEAAAAGLANSWHTVMAHHAGQAVGMARITGDGGCVFQIVDVCVLPEHQRRGVGRMMMAELLAELERRAPHGAFVSLLADGDARHLYAEFGFADAAPASAGMYLRPAAADPHRWMGFSGLCRQSPELQEQAVPAPRP